MEDSKQIYTKVLLDNDQTSNTAVNNFYFDNYMSNIQDSPKDNSQINIKNSYIDNSNIENNFKTNFNNNFKSNSENDFIGASNNNFWISSNTYENDHSYEKPLNKDISNEMFYLNTNSSCQYFMLDLPNIYNVDQYYLTDCNKICNDYSNWTSNLNVENDLSILDELRQLSKNELINLFISKLFKYDISETKELWSKFIKRYMKDLIDICDELDIIYSHFNEANNIRDYTKLFQNDLDILIQLYPPDFDKFISKINDILRRMYSLQQKLIRLKENLKNDVTYKAYLNKELVSLDELREQYLLLKK